MKYRKKDELLKLRGRGVTKKKYKSSLKIEINIKDHSLQFKGIGHSTTKEKHTGYQHSVHIKCLWYLTYGDLPELIMRTLSTLLN